MGISFGGGGGGGAFVPKMVAGYFNGNDTATGSSFVRFNTSAAQIRYQNGITVDDTTSNNKFIIQDAGLYMIMFSMNDESNSTTESATSLTMWVNGATTPVKAIAKNYTNPEGKESTNAYMILDAFNFSANDQIQFRYQTAASARIKDRQYMIMQVAAA